MTESKCERGRRFLIKIEKTNASIKTCNIRCCKKKWKVFVSLSKKKNYLSF